MFSGIQALEAKVQHNIRTNVEGLTRTMQRLSTGKRINSSKDDPSGMIACTLIRSDISKAKGLIKSNQRESSRLSVVESGMNQISSMLNSAKSLVVAAANKGTLTDEQIGIYQVELDQIIDSIRRISKSTNFQGQSVLEGLEGLLNGTLTAEQSAQSLGMSTFSNSEKLYGTTSNPYLNASNEITIGDFAKDLFHALDTVSEINKLAAEDSDSVSLEGYDLLEIRQQDLETENLEDQVREIVNSWIQDRFGTEGNTELGQQLSSSLLKETMQMLSAENTGGNEKTSHIPETPDSLEEMKQAIASSLQSVVEELDARDSEEGEEGDSGTKASSNEIKSLLNSIANKEAERIKAEEEKTAEEQKERDKAEEEKRKTEERAAFEKKLEEDRKRADELYFAQARSFYQPVEEEPEMQSQREIAAEKVQSMFAQGNVGGFLRGFSPQENADDLSTFYRGSFPNFGKKPNSATDSDSQSGNSGLPDPSETKSMKDEVGASLLIDAAAKNSFGPSRKRTQKIGDPFFSNSIPGAFSPENANSKNKTEVPETELKKKENEEKEEENDGGNESPADSESSAFASPTMSVSSARSGEVSKEFVDSETAVNIEDPEVSPYRVLDGKNMEPGPISICDPEEPSPGSTLEIEGKNENKEEDTPLRSSLEDLRSGGDASLKNSPERAAQIIDDLISSLAFSRAYVGVNQRSLEVDNEMLTNQIYHAMELDSLISDADFAEETLNLARYQLLIQSGMNVLKVVQDLPKMMMKMLDFA